MGRDCNKGTSKVHGDGQVSESGALSIFLVILAMPTGKIIEVSSIQERFFSSERLLDYFLPVGIPRHERVSCI